MSLSTTLPSTDPSYTAPIYNAPKPKKLRASLSRKSTTPKEPEDQQAIMQQWHELMQKIQSERQEISALQEEADQKQATYDKNSLTPELKKLMDQVQDLKDEKRDLDYDLARIREKYTPETRADINNEVSELRKDFFFDTEALEQIYDNISKAKNKSKDFYNTEPAKSILEAEKRITELTHKLNDLYRESAQIDVDFEETFNPAPGTKKENRKVTYLERKLKSVQNEVEKKEQEIQQLDKDLEKEKEEIMQKREEEERKKKFRAEMSKNRRREMIAQQCKAAGYDVEPEEKKEEEKKKKNDDDIDIEKMLGLDYDLLNSPKRTKRKRIPKKKKSTQKTDNNNNTATTETTNATKKSAKKLKNNTENAQQANGEDNIFQNVESKNIKERKDDVEIDDERDLVNIGQGNSDSEVQIIGDNETGELSTKAMNKLLKNKDGNNEDGENSEQNNEIENTDKTDEENKDKATEEGNEGENIEKNQNQDDDEYDYIDCQFNQVTLLDVSPEAFSKSPRGNFSSMLSSGLGLLNKDKDQDKLQFGKIKVYKRKNERELTIWSSKEVEDSEDADNDQSSVNILPLYDFEYNQDWKIVSKTLKAATQPVGSLAKSKDQIDNQQSEENDSKEATGETNQEKNIEASENENKDKENAENEEEGNKLSSVVDDVNSLFNKTDQNEQENKENKEENENKNDTQNGEDNFEIKDKNINEKTENNEENKNEKTKNNDENENENEKTENNEENKNDNEKTENGENENENKDEENKNENEKSTKENEEEDDEEKIKDPNEIDDKLEILNGICGTSPNRGDVQEEKKKTFEITVLVDGFLREDRPSENEEFDSMVLLDISPSPLFAKLSDAFKKKGIISAGKFNYDI